MTKEEANKIIAEFMGGEYFPEPDYFTPFVIYKMADGHKSFKAPSVSLDSLVPVWEKLNQNDHFGLNLEMPQDKWWAYHIQGSAQDGGHDTIQEAAAIVTAQVILEI